MAVERTISMARNDEYCISLSAAHKEVDSCSSHKYERINPVSIEFRFGKRIHELRIKRRLPQEVLATRTQVHRNYISDIERGKRNVTLKVIERLAGALEVEIAELFKDMDWK